MPKIILIMNLGIIHESSCVKTPYKIGLLKGKMSTWPNSGYSFSTEGS